MTKNVLRVIRKIDNIVVKEVSVYDLIELYEERLRQNLTEDELEDPASEYRLKIWIT